MAAKNRKVGIISYGGYLPKRRIARSTIYQNIGWYMPALLSVAQGERSFCNWDEDSLTMAVAASQNCLSQQNKDAVNGLFLCSTTMPYSDRQNATIVKEALNLSDNILTNDFSGTLRSATSAILTALSDIKSGDQDSILVSASDQRLAKAGSLYEMLFGDGAAALLLGHQNIIAEFLGGISISQDFVDHFKGAGKKFDYTWEERWLRNEGFSKIILQAVSQITEKLGITTDDIDRIVYPCFFKGEHQKIAKILGLPAEKVADNLHEVCGDCGTAHPLIMLISALEQAQPGETIVVLGFGQGCDALGFKTTEQVLKFSKTKGIQYLLEQGKLESSYTRFLKFRDLIECETGIRAEAPTQTAASVLWRQRKMLSGLIGGLCNECQTPQFPKTDICVNPECKATDSQTDYDFSTRLAKIKTFTGDYLAVSQDPPAIYGMIQFDDGGRMLADFSDCHLEDIFVGQSVEMSFRRRYQDFQKGFSGYFWKAIPQKITGSQIAAQIEKLDFSGQVAIVTGAGGGLGKTYALELARRGAKVVVNDLGSSPNGSGDDQSAADLVVQEIIAAGGQAVADYNTVSSIEGGQAIVATAVKAFGRLDILINNAGILRDKSLSKMTAAEWQAVIDVHLNGAYHVTKPALEEMRKNSYGRIVMTTSAAGLFGNFGQSNYSAAKLGVVGLMNTLKIEGQKHNIQTNTIAPVALTRLTKDIIPAQLAEKMKPEFITPLVIYLCSPKCQHNGQIFNAGAGFFSRAAIVTGPGVLIGKLKEPPTAEDILENIEEIASLDNPQEFGDAFASLAPMMTASPTKKQ
jgi:3-hydroxy-3-methylglutaryl CoA synthase/NAD(P)-dependent dehydrogenase (short-subunit alcohol dehydrogenase family)